MRTAKVTAYFNTGFTGINTPDSPEIFDLPFYRNNSKQLQVLNCLPLSGEPVTSITVKDFPGLEQTDYIKMEFTRGIEGEYDPSVPYFAEVTGYTYTDSETVVISLLMDYWLTCGGITNLQSATGITSRVHVPKADDKLFAFTEEDEMINPARILEAKSERWDIGDLVSQDGESGIPFDMQIVISSLDLYAIGRMYSLYGKTGLPEGCPESTAVKLETDPSTTSGYSELTIPKLYTIGEFNYNAMINGDFEDRWSELLNEYNSMMACGDTGNFYIEAPNPSPNDILESRIVCVTPPAVGIFSAGDAMVRAGISVLHECGVEDAILGSYIIPGGCLTSYKAGTDGEDYTGYWPLNSHTLLGRVYLRSKLAFFTTDTLPFEYGYQACNKKLFSGKVNAYTMVSVTTGDAATFNPEDLPVVDAESETAPIFRMMSDPRQNGGVLCMPFYLNNDPTRWFMNFIKSLSYQNAPITFSGASGAFMNDALTNMSISTMAKEFRVNYPMTLNGQYGTSWSEASDFYITQKTMANKVKLSPIQSGISAASAILTGGKSGGLGGVGEGVGTFASGKMMSEYIGDLYEPYMHDVSDARRELQAQKVANEKNQLMLRNTFVAPNIISQATQTMREIVGNGFLVYKFMMSVADLMRCDKLLNMYGYRHTKDLEKSDFTNRSCYNYIEAGDVHLNFAGRGFSKWLIEGAEQQVSAGIRIWHTNYDPNYYVSGND